MDGGAAPAYTDEFLAILARVFGIEGGIADIKEDRGGYTNMGITIPFLTQYLGRPATKADIDGLTKPVAAAAYWQNIWVGMSIEQFPAWAHEAMFNAACGSRVLFNRMVVRLQQIVGVPADGVWGRDSSTAAAKVSNARKGRNDTINALCEEYELIVSNDATQHIFALGWYRRAYKLFDFGY
jgi:lysozyme family protein